MFRRTPPSGKEELEIKAKQIEIIFRDSMRDLERLDRIEDSKELLRFIAKQLVSLTQILRLQNYEKEIGIRR